jgi:SAM-dependent methyltransferase
MPRSNFGLDESKSLEVDFRPRMIRDRREEIDSLSYDGFRWIVDASLRESGWSVEGGSGLGRYVYYLDRRGFVGVGIEFSKEIARKAKALFRESDFIVADVRRLPILSGSVVNFLSLGVVEHFHDSGALVTEAVRVLKVHGVIIITVPNHYSFWTYIRSYLQQRGRWDIGFERSFSQSEFRTVLESTGLRIMSVREILVVSSFVRLSMLLFQRLVNSIAPQTESLTIRPLFVPRSQALLRILPLLIRTIDTIPIINKLGLLIIAVCKKGSSSE